MNIANKAYSRRMLITVAEVASALAKSRDIAGLEAVMELAQAVRDGSLTADLYPPHQRWVNDGEADRIGVPASNPTEIWRSLSKKSQERHISDKDDFNYPPAASTWHLLADDVFAFANSGTLSNSAAAALRELAVRYKAELGEVRTVESAVLAQPQETAQAAPSPAPASAEQVSPKQVAVTPRQRKKRKTWKDAAWGYVVQVQREGRYRTCNALFNALEDKGSEQGAPIIKGAGDKHRGRLFVVEIGESYELKTFQNAWPEIREAAEGE